MSILEAIEMMKKGYLMTHSGISTFAMWRSGNRIVRQGGLDLTHRVLTEPSFKDGWQIYTSVSILLLLDIGW